MANAFSRSWEITKLSFGAIKKDKEMLLFPILSGIFQIIFMVALLFPTVITALMVYSNGGGSSEIVWESLYYLWIFLVYLGLAFLSTFFNVCVVYTAKTRFAGGNPKFFSTIGYAFKKIHLIFMWSMLSATVGLIMVMLDNLAQKVGGVGEIVIRIVRSIAGMAWSLVTIFVVPAMVYHDLSPFKAIKKSAKTLSKTWGETLIRRIGLGLMKFLFILLGIGIAVGSGYLFAYLNLSNVIIYIIIATVIYIMVVLLVFGAAEKVYNTALYVYADKGKIPKGFTKSTLKGAFEVKI